MENHRIERNWVGEGPIELYSFSGPVTAMLKSEEGLMLSISRHDGHQLYTNLLCDLWHL